MLTKNLLLLCSALTAACTPLIIADGENEVTKGNCKKFRNVKVCNNLIVDGSASIGGSLNVNGSENIGGSVNIDGSLNVDGSVTAERFITPSGGPILNWAVFSNQAEVTNAATFPWDATLPTSVTAGIKNNAGTITLPIGGTFMVTYTARVTITGPASGGGAFVELLQGSTSGGFDFPGQPVVIKLTDELIDVGEIIESQITGQAIIITTSTANNQIKLQALLEDEPTYSIPAAPFFKDANATMTIQQLN